MHEDDVVGKNTSVYHAIACCKGKATIFSHFAPTPYIVLR